MGRTQTVNMGHINNFLPQIGRVVVIEGKEVAVFRTSDDSFYAVDNSSPHPKGGPLAEGIISGHYLYDPLYDWKIDLTTGMVQAPDQGEVAVYPIRVEHDEVHIEF
ncbi:nitrite reductase small subunit NirD [Paenibacillus caui]|uniref:nitrite reductase small subunit NirD n=1 Tax=Paenibacillus caui TaxID=2873927 RepID=UPI001CA92675|nr:nitrite reductase small subunit NirD [Paenibacillus caui]